MELVHRYADTPRPPSGDSWPRPATLAMLLAATVVVVLVVLGLVGPTATRPVREAVPTVGFSAPPRQLPTPT